jgi:hypothetical protein
MFAEPVLESAYMETQGQTLAHMDMLFIVVNVAVLLCYVWTSSSMGAQASSSSSSSLQLVLWACCHLGLLLVAAVWLLASPGSYGRWRETLWVVHRVVAALQGALLVLLSPLQQQGLLLGGGMGPVGAAAAASVTYGALGLHKGKALALLAQNLGLKVGPARAHTHTHMHTHTHTRTHTHARTSCC